MDEAANLAQQAAIAINMKKKGKKPKSMNEGSLHKWFKGSKSKDGKGGWVNVVTGGTCASDEPGEGTPKCVSSSKRASMSKKERLSASRRKKKADPGQQSKTGAAKPTYVSTDKKKKLKEFFNPKEIKPTFPEKPPVKLDPKTGMHPMYGKQAGRYKKLDPISANAMPETGDPEIDATVNAQKTTGKKKMKEELEYIDLPLEVEIPNSESKFNLGLMFRESLDTDKGMLFIFEEVGKHSFHMKNTRIPLDVAFIKEDGTIESIKELNPHTLLPVSSDGEVLFAIEANRGWFIENNVEVGDEIVLGEAKDKKGKGSGSKDACYHKVKSRYSVWPSAYASGALVKCRKVGAANWGNKSEGYIPEEGYDQIKDRIAMAGGDPSSPKKSDATTRPVSKEIKKQKGKTVLQKQSEKKYGKGATALDIVKKKITAKHGKGAIMGEELDSKDKPFVKDLVKKLRGGSKTHAKQADDLEKAVNEDIKRDEYGDPVGGPKISKKQKAKNLASNTPDEQHTTTTSEEKLDEKCWPGYEKKGMKTMFGKRYPNCVKKKVKKEEFSNWRDEVGYEDKDSSKKIDEDWQKVNRKDKTDGLSQKAVNAYRKENPGSKLKTAVTKDPKKLKKGSKSAKRRLSFCRRMKGMKKKLTSAKTSRDPDSRINKALRRWNCSYEPTGTTITEKSVSKKQQRFFGIVRAAQKGTLEGEASPQVQRAATSMTKKDVKKYASTDHKGLPEKVKSEE